MSGENIKGAIIGKYKQYEELTMDDLQRMNSEMQNELLEIIILHEQGNIYDASMRFFRLFGLPKKSEYYEAVKRRISECKKLLL